MRILPSCNSVEATTKDSEADGKKGMMESLTSLFSSKKEEIVLDPQNYMAWCENKENGLIADKQIGNFSFSAFYKTNAYQALKESIDLDSLNETEFNKTLNEYGDMQYFSFRITDTKGNQELLKTNLKSESEYYARIEYLSFKMQDNFKLIDGTDTLKCSLYHFERVYGLAPYATFVLGFPKSKTSEINGKSLVYEDNLFNNGLIYLNIDKETLTNLPKLKF
jgi:hypothetical protein